MSPEGREIMNIWDWIIILLIAAAVFGAVRNIRNGKRSGCHEGCAGCPYHCEMKKEEPR